MTTSKADDLIASLPATCPSIKILDWIASHRLMDGGCKPLDDEGRIVLEYKDLVGCPSRTALNELRCYIMRPDKFFDKLLYKQTRPLSREVMRDESESRDEDEEAEEEKKPLPDLFTQMKVDMGLKET